MSSGVAFSVLQNPVDLECSICKTSDETTWVAHDTDQKVQHVFHYKCLIDWAKTLWASQGKATCPLCVKVIDIKTLAAETDLDELIKTKNEAGKQYEKEINQKLVRGSLITALVTGAFLSSIDINLSDYNITGIATTAVIYLVAGNLGKKSMPHRNIQFVAAFNSAFCGGLTAALHLIDPLSIRSTLVSGFLYAGLSMGISRLYLPGKVKFIPTDTEQFHVFCPLEGTSTLIGMVGLVAWRYFR